MPNGSFHIVEVLHNAPGVALTRVKNLMKSCKKPTIVGIGVVGNLYRATCSDGFFHYQPGQMLSAQVFADEQLLTSIKNNTDLIVLIERPVRLDELIAIAIMLLAKRQNNGSLLQRHQSCIRGFLEIAYTVYYAGLTIREIPASLTVLIRKAMQANDNTDDSLKTSDKDDKGTYLEECCQFFASCLADEASQEELDALKKLHVQNILKMRRSINTATPTIQYDEHQDIWVEVTMHNDDRVVIIKSNVNIAELLVYDYNHADIIAFIHQSTSGKIDNAVIYLHPQASTAPEHATKMLSFLSGEKGWLHRGMMIFSRKGVEISATAITRLILNEFSIHPEVHRSGDRVVVDTELLEDGDRENEIETAVRAITSSGE